MAWVARVFGRGAEIAASGAIFSPALFSQARSPAGGQFLATAYR